MNSKPDGIEQNNDKVGLEGDPAPKKKPYNTPRLTVYGDIMALTKSTSNTGGQNDGGSGVMIKTA